MDTTSYLHYEVFSYSSYWNDLFDCDMLLLLCTKVRMMSRQRRLHPPHSLVIRMSKKNRVPYRKGFKTNNLPLTDPQIVTINPAPMPVQSIPESFVQEGPVHITPTPPPKPVPFFVCYKQTTLYEFE